MRRRPTGGAEPTTGSAGVVSTVFPAATGGTPPYVYRLTGLPPCLAFAPSSRCLSGTAPTVAADTAYALTYRVTDRAGGADSSAFVATVTAPSAPPQPPTRVRRTLETRVGLVFATETDSPGRTYSFSLASRQTVNVSLTGMNRDIDCSVNGSRCSNRGGRRDDDWSGELAAGSHSVRVYPYLGGRGNYTVTAIVNCPAGHFAYGGSCYRYVVPDPPTAAFGGDGPEVLSCDGDTELAEGLECVDGVVVFPDKLSVTGTAPPPPPPPPTPSGTADAERHRRRRAAPPTPSGTALAAATSDVNCQGWNIDDGDGFDAPRPSSNGGTRPHMAIDIQVGSADATFFALGTGVISNNALSSGCGFQTAVRYANGARNVYCHMDGSSRLPTGTVVDAGDPIGTYGPSGETSGPHLHLKVTDSDDNPIDPVEAAGGEYEMMIHGFTFFSYDSEHCAEE